MEGLKALKTTVQENGQLSVGKLGVSTSSLSFDHF
jgi:hypothetical protein